MSLDWRPESAQAAGVRFAAAFDRLWDFSAARSTADVAAAADRPGLCRDHVFDIESRSGLAGYRFIASRSLQLVRPVGGGGGEQVLELCRISVSRAHPDFAALDDDAIDQADLLFSPLLVDRPMGGPINERVVRGILHRLYFTPPWVYARTTAQRGAR
jgi:hypothetical protein